MTKKNKQEEPTDWYKYLKMRNLCEAKENDSIQEPGHLM